MRDRRKGFISPIIRAEQRPNQRPNQRSDQQSDQSEHLQGHAQPLSYALSRIVVILARLALSLLLLSLILRAFEVGPETGIRSIVATVLPPIFTTYATFASQSSQRRSSISRQPPSLVVYIICTLWMILLLILTRATVAYSYRTLPIGEFTLSATLSLFVAISNRLPFKTLVSCGYGIISGVLIYILIFGLAF